LCRAIKDDPGKLAEDGYIQALESIEDTAESVGWIAWDRPPETIPIAEC